MSQVSVRVIAGMACLLASSIPALAHETATGPHWDAPTKAGRAPETPTVQIAQAPPAAPSLTPAPGVADPPDEVPRTPAAPNARVFFIDLKDGDTIPERATIRFGIENIGLVPAGTKRDNAGHHHLLIDTPLPPLDREIPSDFNHVHFGRGQTEVTLNLTPGEHTLQLLLADHDHVPHDPPVMSPRITVKVVAAQAPAQTAERTGRTPAPPDAAVYFIYPRNGDTIYSTSTIRFGLRNMGVAPAGVVKPDTGHHHLLIDVPTPPLDAAIPADLNHIHFGAGQTERRITLPPGQHTLQLMLGDHDHVPHDPPVMSERITVTVLPPGGRRRR